MALTCYICGTVLPPHRVSLCDNPDCRREAKRQTDKRSRQRAEGADIPLIKATRAPGAPRPPKPKYCAAYRCIKD